MAFYKYDIIAKAGDLGIQKLENRPSINDLGQVALVGDFDTNVFGSNAVFVGDGSTPLKQISSTTESSRAFGTAVQINNSGQVIANWRYTTGLGAN
jgi:hypothetical protein